jgi:cardiolipin synthase
VKRGVKVKMIISGSSDIMIVKYAERYWYDWLMRNNIEIYEYTKTVLHGKLAICDSEWMTIGSYNVNNLSAYASIELNLDVRNADFIKKVDSVLESIIKEDCILISKETYKRSNHVIKRFSQWFSYNLIRVTLGLFTFYYKRQKS